MIVNLPTSIQGYHPGHITALGEALKPLVGRLNPPAGGNTITEWRDWPGMPATNVKVYAVVRRGAT